MTLALADARYWVPAFAGMTICLLSRAEIVEMPSHLALTEREIDAVARGQQLARGKPQQHRLDLERDTHAEARAPDDGRHRLGRARVENASGRFGWETWGRGPGRNG